MKALAGCLLALFVTALGTMAAQAQADINIGGTTVKLAVPEGFCPLDMSNPVEKAYFNNMDVRARPTNEVLSVFWECKALAAWRKGTANLVQDVAEYVTPTQYRSKTVTAGEIIPRMCAGFRTASQAVVNERLGATNKRSEGIKDPAPRAALNAARLYGVLHEDATSCYMAILKDVSVEKQNVTQIGINVATVVKGKIVLFSRETNFTGESIIPVLLAQIQEMVAVLMQNN